MQIIFMSLILVLLGVVMSIYGYRIFLVMLPIWGFFAGFWLGADVTSLILGSGFLGSVTSWVVGFVVGLVFAAFSYMYYGVAVAFQAAVIGYGIGNGLVAAFLGPGIVAALVGMVFAIIVLVLTFAFDLQKYVVIAITSILGSNAVLLSVLLLLGRVTLQSLQFSGTTIIPIVKDSWLWLLAWLVLAGAGIWGQIRANSSYEFQRETYLEGWG